MLADWEGARANSAVASPYSAFLKKDSVIMILYTERVAREYHYISRCRCMHDTWLFKQTVTTLSPQLTSTVPLPPHRPGPGLVTVTLPPSLSDGASLHMLGPVAVRSAAVPVKFPR
jgi:hypothetical protein